MVRTFTALAFIALMVLSGCKHAGGFGGGKALAETAIVAAAVTTRAIANASQESSSGSGSSDPDPTPQPYPPGAPLPPFNETEARAELRNIDTTACVASAATNVHTRVTFEPDGFVTQVVVDEPHDLPEPLSRCIGEALSAAHVYSFDGTDATTTISLTLHAR